MPAASSRPGRLTTTPNGLTRGSATSHRRRKPPSSPQRAIGCATPTSFANRPLLHPRQTAYHHGRLYRSWIRVRGQVSKCATFTHDYKCNGTTTLFAALSVLEGKVIGRCVPRHRHQEFIDFIATVERSVPPGKVIHAILDNYAAHKHPEVLAWLAAHPRWTFHFTPTSCSWLNAVEGFFSRLTRQSLKRGVFRSVDELEKTIARYIAATNKSPKPFVWTATAKAIRTKLDVNHPSESVH